MGLTMDQPRGDRVMTNPRIAVAEHGDSTKRLPVHLANGPARVRVWIPFVRLYRWSLTGAVPIAFLSADALEDLHVFGLYWSGRDPRIHENTQLLTSAACDQSFLCLRRRDNPIAHRFGLWP
jgi:hypothetical protein